MFILDSIRFAIKTLFDRKIRAALTIIGIAIGPLALVMMTSVVEGYSNYIVSSLQSLGQNLILVTPNEDFRLTFRDLDTIRSLSGVYRAEPFYITQGKIKFGTEEKNVVIYALPIDFILEAIANLEVLVGSVPPSTQIVRGVVGYNIAFDDDGSQMYSTDDSITITLYKVESGGRVKTRRVTILISAVLNKFGGAFTLNPDETIFLNLDAGPKLLGLKEWSGILILAESSDIVFDIQREIRDRYRDSVTVVSFQGIANAISSVTSAINFIMFTTSLSAFAVAVAGVAATMITSVIERVREIGVMKAVGFTDRQVLLMILCEGLVMSLIGGLIGIVLGIIGAHILASRGLRIRAGLTQIAIYVAPVISPQLIAKTVLITLLVGIIGGIFPAYKAAKIPPAVALRYE